MPTQMHRKPLRRRSSFLSTRNKYPIPIMAPPPPPPPPTSTAGASATTPYIKPTRRDTAAFTSGFSTLTLDTDDPHAIENFHTWKKQFEIGFKSAQLEHQLQPATGNAATSGHDDFTDYNIWDQQLLSILSKNVSGSQLANAILPCDTGQKAWHNLCARNQSKHMRAAIEYILELHNEIWPQATNDPRTVITNMERLCDKLIHCDEPLKVVDPYLKAMLIGRFVKSPGYEGITQSLLGHAKISYAEVKEGLTTYHDSYMMQSTSNYIINPHSYSTSCRLQRQRKRRKRQRQTYRVDTIRDP